MIILYRVESDGVSVSGSDEISVGVDDKIPGIILSGKHGVYEIRFRDVKEAEEFLEKMIRVVEKSRKFFGISHSV